MNLIRRYFSLFYAIFMGFAAVAVTVYSVHWCIVTRFPRYSWFLLLWVVPHILLAVFCWRRMRIRHRLNPETSAGVSVLRRVISVVVAFFLSGFSSVLSCVALLVVVSVAWWLTGVGAAATQRAHGFVGIQWPDGHKKIIEIQEFPDRIEVRDENKISLPCESKYDRETVCVTLHEQAIGTDYQGKACVTFALFNHGPFLFPTYLHVLKFTNGCWAGPMLQYRLENQKTKELVWTITDLASPDDSVCCISQTKDIYGYWRIIDLFSVPFDFSVTRDQNHLHIQPIVTGSLFRGFLDQEGYKDKTAKIAILSNGQSKELEISKNLLFMNSDSDSLPEVPSGEVEVEIALNLPGWPGDIHIHKKVP